MQSMFRLPWSSEPPGDKIMEKSAFHKSRPLPVVEMPAFMRQLKRKPTGSPEPPSPNHAHVVKKWKSANGEVKATVLTNGVADRVNVMDAPVTQPAAASQEPEGAPKPPKIPKAQKPVVKAITSDNAAAPTVMEKDLTRAQQVIEAQFNYEILLKHNELRLIEQELAKCQVALEQLRRCQLIPYPGSEAPSLNVTGGVGPALQPTPGYTEPQFAAPWGVADGPYTRHYAKWLIPDPKFDSIPERELAAQSQGYFGIGEGRATRGSFAEYPSTSKARTSRTSTGTLKLQALGENPAPAPKIDPLLHKRSTDGQWVRLYCAQCGHSNFSNTQGFLNHCRIKHNQVFKSHDAAAIACGVPVEVNEGGTPVQTAEPPSATPLVTPTVTFPPLTTPGFVHPLIRANPTAMAKEVHRDFSTHSARDEPAPAVAPSAFVPSPATPYMDSLLKKRGFDGNLKQMVDTARTPVDIETMETSEDEAVDAVLPTPTAPHSKATASQQLARHPLSAPTASMTNTLSARSGGQKGQPTGHGHPRMQRTAVPPPVQVHGSTPGMKGSVHRAPSSPLDLSPHTVESNPGLVSDHDDDEDEDGDDAHSEPRIEHGDFVMADDVVVEDASDVEGAERRAGSRKGFGGCYEKGEGSKRK
ncbi:hypothetical protein GQ43DRAFT_369091 [Delitschia confertaspora ATCC 74209]|uniref:AHC1-like C2H2 zinc-finger domain-containing protein n=1 Tax=Delitschia confertaspora ATCC 74209 TaxID=1513339 RepID=A0A9P4JMY6_9PLEO|nr:hypothetical protein GQ43DRAFT_369091 [Delitschia confertaspora ATCC 74209]